MPDESCRNCGGPLLDYSVCAKCRAPTRFVCKICSMKTLERFHDGLCFRLENGLNKTKYVELVKPITKEK